MQYFSSHEPMETVIYRSFYVYDGNQHSKKIVNLAVKHMNVCDL